MNKAYARLAASSLIAILCIFSAIRPAYAEIEWTEKKQLKLEAPPVDVVTSPDGKWLIILTQGEVLTYSISEDKITDRMSVDKSFNKITYSIADGAIVISSSTGNLVKIIKMDVVHSFSLADTPVKGPDTAAVTLVVFSDYQ